MRDQIFEIIKNQIKNNEPPETKITYSKLIELGFSEMETMKMIGQCVAVEIFEILKNKKPFDERRYIRNLDLLPQSPV